MRVFDSTNQPWETKVNLDRGTIPTSLPALRTERAVSDIPTTGASAARKTT